MVGPSEGNTPGTLQPECVSTQWRRIATLVRQPLCDPADKRGRNFLRKVPGANLPDEEPDAGNPHVRICEGRGGQPPRLLDSGRRPAGRDLGDRGRGVLYKQSQFPAGGPETVRLPPRPRGLRPAPARVVQTKPMAPAGAGPREVHDRSCEPLGGRSIRSVRGKGKGDILLFPPGRGKVECPLFRR